MEATSTEWTVLYDQGPMDGPIQVFDATDAYPEWERGEYDPIGKVRNSTFS